MTTYRYAPIYRPPTFATLPVGWQLVERGRNCRVDFLPYGTHPFGVVEYDRRLTEDECERYQLQPV